MGKYEDAAPTLSQFVDEETFRADFPPKVEPAQAPAAEPTQDKKRAVYDHIKAVFATGRRSVEVRRVAKDLKVPAEFVLSLFKQVKAAYAAVNAAPEE
jgi:hypothetical protein